MWRTDRHLKHFFSKRDVVFDLPKDLKVILEILNSINSRLFKKKFS